MRHLFSFLLLSLLSLNAFADVVNLGEFKYWSAYKNADGVRYIVSFPVKVEGNYNKRERPYLMVAVFPDGATEVSAYVGYHYKHQSLVDAVISMSNVDITQVKKMILTTRQDMAWNSDVGNDLNMIEAFKLGAKVTISAESTRHTFSRDTYSLNGFTDAYSTILNKK